MTFINIIIAIGVPAIVIALIYIGRKLQILDDLQKTIGRIKLNLKVIGDFLTRNHSEFNPTELQGYSPLELTAEGQRFIHNIGFTGIFSKQKADFFACIDNEQPKLKYDVEAAAIKSIYTLSDRDYMAFLKEYFYNNPTRNLGNTAPTFGVYVRDKYLEEHTEIRQ
jgi:hypothetical protein